MPIKHNNIEFSWKQVFQSNLKYLYLLTFVCLLVFQQINLHVLLYVQHRVETIHMFDPILQILTPRQIGFELDIFFYGTLGVLLVYFFKKPKLLLLVLHALLLMWLLRWATMYLLPLGAPPHKVPLHDVIAYSHYKISRDLFFSGHTATLFIALCAVRQRWIFVFVLLMMLVIISLLLIGHQHYFLDVLAAPFFSYVCYRIAKKINILVIPLLSKNLQAVRETSAIQEN